MSWTSAAKGAGKVTGSTIGKFLYSLKIFFYFFIILAILGSAIMAIYNEQNISAGIKVVGERLIGVTHSLNENSLKIIEQKGIYPDTGSFFKNIWEFFTTIYKLMESLFIIYIWIKVLTWINMHFGIWDSSKGSVAVLYAIVFFFIIQMFYILIFIEASVNSAMVPLKSFWNLIKALPHIFKPVAGLADKFSGGNESVFRNLTQNVS